MQPGSAGWLFGWGGGSEVGNVALLFLKKKIVTKTASLASSGLVLSCSGAVVLVWHAKMSAVTHYRDYTSQRSYDAGRPFF